MQLHPVSLTLEQLVLIFKPFLDRLVNDCGNDRQDMVDYHLTRLEGLTVSQVLRKMPKGPKGRWGDMMADIRYEIKNIHQ